MDGEIIRPLRPTTRLMVVLGDAGVQLLNPHAAPPIKLSFEQIVTISEIDRGAYGGKEGVAAAVNARIGANPDDISAFVRSLVRFGRVSKREQALPPGILATAPEPLTAFDLSPGSRIALKLPLALRLYGGHFQLIDHAGCLIAALSPAELFVLGKFSRPAGVQQVLDAQSGAVPASERVSAGQLAAVLARLDAAGLIQRIELDEGGDIPSVQRLSRTQACRENFARQAAEQDAREAERVARTGVRRPKVIPVSFGESVPAALGLIFANAKAHMGGILDEFYDFRLDWFWDDDRLAGYTEAPAIYLFSNYLWSHQGCIGVSEKVKARSPNSITIHGGPDTPKYEEDARAYFANYPHVDVIVRGEGEATATEVLDKLRQVIGQAKPDLSVLEGVAGVSYRHGDRIVRNPDRERIMDLDTIPSPYLTGLFDAYIGVPRLHVTIETNRGCPYGCTFCDWGSATTSKIRKFDMDRIFGELEWISRSKVQSVSVADANFGVFERDVAVAEKVAMLKRTTGWPEAFGGSYAKNSTKYLQKIIKIMADAGILTQGVLSLQTMDDSTLEVIHRENIKVEKYDALANEMRNSKLQLSIELMMGLPGATLVSFLDDLQKCIDRDIQARINHTTLLVNSPMNKPEYRAQHKIETGTELGPGKMPVLVSTATYTREDMHYMQAMRVVYLFLDNFGVLRLCARYVHQETGMTEMDFYCKLFNTAARPELEATWPLLNTLINEGPKLMAPVYSWALVINELRAFLVQECGLIDDSALSAVLSAQLALLPAHDRQYPVHVELAHDVVAWHSQMLAAKEAGHWRDWPMVVPPLREFGPGYLDVDDSAGSVSRLLGCDVELSAIGVTWDMDSGIARARVDQQFVPAWQPENLAEVI